MIKLIDLLKEVGEGTAEPFKVTRVSDTDYEFETSDGTNYVIELVEQWDTQLLVNFGVKGDDDYSTITNKGDLFRIMATVLIEVKKYIQENPNIDEVVIIPSKSSDTDTRRTNLYMAYIKKQLPKDWTVIINRIGGDQGVDEIVLRKKEDSI
jgi:hypothetical protein